jgi:hypothetical protein
MAQRLAQVVDKAALDDAEGGRARLKITVPGAWFAAGAQLDVQAPKLMACDRCDGGGCDGCDRSGALRGPREPMARRVALHIPASTAGQGLVLRLVRPFDEGEIDQLMVQVRAGEEASKGVTRVEAVVVASPRALEAPWGKIALVAAAIIAVITALVI